MYVERKVEKKIKMVPILKKIKLNSCYLQVAYKFNK